MGVLGVWGVRGCNPRVQHRKRCSLWPAKVAGSGGRLWPHHSLQAPRDVIEGGPLGGVLCPALRGQSRIRRRHGLWEDGPQEASENALSYERWGQACGEGAGADGWQGERGCTTTGEGGARCKRGARWRVSCSGTGGKQGHKEPQVTSWWMWLMRLMFIVYTVTTN